MSRIRHDRIRLYMIKADSFCVRGSVEYSVKMELGSFRTMTVLFIMILPEQEMGLKKLVERQCGIDLMPVQRILLILFHLHTSLIVV